MSHIVTHYICGRKNIYNSKEYQTCGECIARSMGTSLSNRTARHMTTSDWRDSKLSLNDRKGGLSSADDLRKRSLFFKTKTSLSTATTTGYNSKPSMSITDHIDREDFINSLHNSCNGARVFSQMDYANKTRCSFPQIEYLILLMKVFPEAKFVYLYRPVGNWLQSVNNFFDLKYRLLDCLKHHPSLFPKYNNMISVAKEKYFNNSDVFLMDWYEWHKNRVGKLFKQHHIDCLFVDIEDDMIAVEKKLDHYLGNTLSSLLQIYGIANTEVSNCWTHSNKNYHLHNRHN